MDVAQSANCLNRCQTAAVLDRQPLQAQDISARRASVALVEGAQRAGATVLVCSSRHVTGERLGAYGGVAALLRFPCPDLADFVDHAPPPPAGPDDAALAAALDAAALEAAADLLGPTKPKQRARPRRRRRRQLSAAARDPHSRAADGRQFG